MKYTIISYTLKIERLVFQNAQLFILPPLGLFIVGNDKCEDKS